MPRQPRLDAPGALHHIMGRGIARTPIFQSDDDRADFVDRLAALCRKGQFVVYAWALLPNHFHLLLRTGARPLAQGMQTLLTGYVVNFNRRHQRTGHLFQNRYKSIVVEEDAYFRELVRYLHLNPLRARLVPDLPHLDRYPWAGHAGILGRPSHPWQDRAAVLAWFGPAERAASRAYREFLRAGLPQGRRPELVGGGLVRSLGGWAAVRAIRQRADRVRADERILGTGPFVERMLAAGDARQRTQRARGHRLRDAQARIRRHCRQAQVGLEELRMGSRRRPIASARARLAVHLVTRLGLSLADAARLLGVSTSGIAKIIAKGDKE